MKRRHVVCDIWSAQHVFVLGGGSLTMFVKRYNWSLNNVIGDAIISSLCEKKIKLAKWNVLFLSGLLQNLKLALLLHYPFRRHRHHFRFVRHRHRFRLRFPLKWHFLSLFKKINKKNNSFNLYLHLPAKCESTSPSSLRVSAVAPWSLISAVPSEFPALPPREVTFFARV